MTATVTEDAALGFWTQEALESLLREHPELCHEFLAVMADGLAENLSPTMKPLTWYVARRPCSPIQKYGGRDGLGYRCEN